MTDIAVTNASPIIYLARTNFFDLLHLAATEVLVPAAVADEILVRGMEDPAARALNDAPWIRKVEVPEIPDSVLAWDLGAGESAVIAWALSHPGCLAVIDDLEGRRCAETRGPVARDPRARAAGQTAKRHPQSASRS